MSDQKPTAIVVATFSGVTAAQVWALSKDFERSRYVWGAYSIDLVGGPGLGTIRRMVFGGENTAYVIEELASLDEDSHSLVYRALSGGLDVNDYHTEMVVAPLEYSKTGNHLQCTLTWNSYFTTKDTDPDPAGTKALAASFFVTASQRIADYYAAEVTTQTKIC